MKPKNFKGANVVYGAGQPEYTPLPAKRLENKSGQINTCWELSPEDIKRVQETGVIWVSVLTFGQPLQPILVAVDEPEDYDPE